MDTDELNGYWCGESGDIEIVQRFCSRSIYVDTDIQIEIQTYGKAAWTVKILHQSAFHS